MKQLLIKIKKALTKVRNFFPSRLPVGMIEFNVWADSIIHTYDFPDNDSVRFALATMILHCNATDAYKPKHYFAMCSHKSMSNQIAAGVMQDLKDKQKAAAEAEAKKNAEAVVQGTEA